MHPPDADVVLIRHGEIGVKSNQVRTRMERRLAGNVEALLAGRGVDASVERRRNRLYVHVDCDEDSRDGDESSIERATEAAADCFGVVSASPATVVDPTIDAIGHALAETARVRYDGGPFAVDARRAGEPEAHPFSSEDIEREGGAAIWRAIEDLDGDPEVDLDDPAFEVFVECRDDAAYVFLEKRDGPGGLPLGTQSPMVALLSGGIDSPVAAWEVMRRGSPIVPVYVDLGDLGGPDHRARAIATAEGLAAYAPNFDLDVHVVPGGEVVEDLVDAMGELRMLALRRFMVAVGEAVAREHDAVGVVTGEAIGQKSSQTASNLAVTDAAVALPVHRPNLTRDKDEIVAQAREIGTFHDSTIPAGCNRVAPSFPETNADLTTVEDVEPDDLLARARTVAAEAETVDVSVDSSPSVATE